MQRGRISQILCQHLRLRSKTGIKQECMGGGVMKSKQKLRNGLDVLETFDK